MRYLKRNYKSAFFTQITPNEIIEIVRNLKNRSSSGFDEIDVKIVKKVIHIICIPLSNIFNSSMTSGIFPEKMKIAKVIPVYKTGSTESVNNYRPISVLPMFSKIYEKCLYNRLLKFLNQCNIITDSQYGFRSGRSTSSALVDLIHKVSNAFDKKKI